MDFSVRCITFAFRTHTCSLSKCSNLTHSKLKEMFYTIRNLFFAASDLSLSRICLHSPSLHMEPTKKQSRRLYKLNLNTYLNSTVRYPSEVQ